MTDASNPILVAMLKDKANTRTVLATELIARNAQINHMREDYSIKEFDWCTTLERMAKTISDLEAAAKARAVPKTGAPRAPIAATKIVAPHRVDTTSRDAFRAKCEARRAAVLAYFKNNPGAKPVSDRELVELGYL